MVAEKYWEGVEGFAVSDEVKVTISAAASLLTLGLSGPYYFDQVHTIIVHPRAIKNRKMHRGMFVDESESYFSGMAWQNGPLVFSWPNVIAGTRQRGDGFNVVIHEFAHHIDGLDGEMGGIPIIESQELKQRWEDSFPKEFRRLQKMVETGGHSGIDPYAATNLAEFFAVSTETFFDSPRKLKSQFPEVYELLRAYFGLDPIKFD